MRYTLILCVLSIVLAGCGFQPLHGRAVREAMSNTLTAVQIDTDTSRRGQLLKAEIEDGINPDYRHNAKLYSLSIAFSEQEIALFVNPDGTSSRGDLQYQSTYKLVRLKDSKVIAQGNITRISSYNTSVNADYATYVSEEDARKRGILELAQDYKLRLANLLPLMNDPDAKEAPPPPPITPVIIPSLDSANEIHPPGH